MAAPEKRPFTFGGRGASTPPNNLATRREKSNVYLQLFNALFVQQSRKRVYFAHNSSFCFADGRDKSQFRAINCLCLFWQSPAARPRSPDRSLGGRRWIGHKISKPVSQETACLSVPLSGCLLHRAHHFTAFSSAVCFQTRRQISSFIFHPLPWE